MSGSPFLPVALGVLFFALTGPLAAQQPAPADPWGVMHPFWASRTMQNETLFFVADQPDQPASARLLFEPTKILSVRSADLLTEYQEGKDFRLGPDGRSLVLPPGSRIPSKTLAQLYPAPDSPHSIRQRRDGASYLLFGEGHFFHDMQASVTYTHDDTWTGKAPTFQRQNLARTIALLKERHALTISVSGDSISAGCNASLLTDAPPHQPAYPQLVATGLERAYAARVTVKNHAVGGWKANQGAADAPTLAAGKPALVIIAYGMNDGYPALYADSVRKIMEAVRAVNPDADFILVASMMGNSDWSGINPDKFVAFRDALADLCGPGVALADMTELWQELLKSKRFLDLTGNGVNHPNDFGHRLYAQTILALLIEDYGRE